MAKILLLFGSTTGNTESMAERIKSKLEGAGHEVMFQNVLEASPDDIVNHDILVFGSSTWNDGELQDDFIEYYMQLESEPPQLTGKKFAAFGPGESVYELFCKAVDDLEEGLTKWGATKLIESLKIDGYPEEQENITKIENWSDQLVTSLQ